MSASLSTVEKNTNGRRYEYATAIAMPKLQISYGMGASRSPSQLKISLSLFPETITAIESATTAASHRMYPMKIRAM